jgi:PEP-CTERM motif
MAKCLGIVAAGLLAFGAANASPILVDPTKTGSDVDANITSSSCLGCFVDVSLSDDLEGAMDYLDTGDSFTFDFFDIVVGGFIGTAQVAVDATLALASPDTSAIGSGFGGFASFLFVLNAGHLSWIQPGAIDLGDGTFLGVSFEDLFEFGIGNSTTVSATISRYEVASVPEPGTAALLVVGLLALWFGSRRRPFGRSGFRAAAA